MVASADEACMVFPCTDLQDCVSLLESSVSLLEPRFCARVLRALPGLRKRLDVSALTTALNVYYPAGESDRVIVNTLSCVLVTQALASLSLQSPKRRPS